MRFMMFRYGSSHTKSLRVSWLVFWSAPKFVIQQSPFQGSRNTWQSKQEAVQRQCGCDVPPPWSKFGEHDPPPQETVQHMPAKPPKCRLPYGTLRNENPYTQVEARRKPQQTSVMSIKTALPYPKTCKRKQVQLGWEYRKPLATSSWVCSLVASAGPYNTSYQVQGLELQPHLKPCLSLRSLA